jgi:hypothetical protein
VDEVRTLLEEAMRDGSPELKKTVFRALIEGNQALPTYRLPWSVVRTAFAGYAFPVHVSRDQLSRGQHDVVGAHGPGGAASAASKRR